MSSTSSPPITHDSPLFPSNITFDPSRLVGSPEDLRKLVAQETQRRLQVIHETGDLLPKPPRDGNRWACRQGNSLVDPPRGNRDIIRVARVCKYWRTVIIQNPWLWTSFPIHNHHGVWEFLERSKKLPICLSLTRRFTSNFAPVLASSAHRIRSLYVSTELADDIELLWAELSSPAPNLQELFIEHVQHSSLLVDGHAVGRVEHLPPMFDGEVPSLRILTLRGVPSPFTVMPPSLVHFDIGTSQGPLPPFNELLKTLGNCPLLETLNLRGAWEWDEFVNYTLVRNRVALSKLSATYLELDPQEAPGVLLSSLALPTHTNVVISSVLEDANDFPRILKVVVPPLAPPCFNGFRRLQVFREGKDWRLQAYRDADAFLDPPVLDIDVIDALGDPQVDWAGFLYDWPFDASQIETLVLGTFDQWDAMFGQLPALRILRVMGLPTSELEVLLVALRHPQEPDPRDGVCPGLTTLEVFDVQLSSRAEDCLVSVAVSRRLGGTGKSTLKRVELFNPKPSDNGWFKCLKLNALGVEVVVDEEIIHIKYWDGGGYRS